MGYRPDKESLEDPINSIIVGVKEFDSAVNSRIEAGDWTDEHIKRIDEIRIKLNELKTKLVILKEETW